MIRSHRILIFKFNKLEIPLQRIFSCQLSTAAETQTNERLQTFRTSEDDPRNHTSNHAGQYYKLPEDVKKQLFLHGGLPKTFEIQSKTFNESCIMVRQPAIDILSCLKTLDYSKPCVRFVLYGKKGTGKSLTLAHILHYGLNSGYLLVHVPWVGNWMRRSKEYSNSETKEGYIDLNIDAAAWLVHFKTQNSHILNNSDLKISEEIVWNKRESTPKDAPFTEIIEHGISRVKFASRCIVILAKEIKRLSREGKLKTLVTVDGFNAFFYPNTRVFADKKQVVPPSKITLTEAFLELTNFDWNNAVAVVTVDEIAIAEKDQISHLPRYLLGKDGFEHLDPFIPVLVPSYSPKEITSCLDYYRERRWIQPYPGQDKELTFLSGSNPYKLMQLCNPL